jgi:hypothetical protein
MRVAACRLAPTAKRPLGMRGAAHAQHLASRAVSSTLGSPWPRAASPTRFIIPALLRPSSTAGTSLMFRHF